MGVAKVTKPVTTEEDYGNALLAANIAAKGVLCAVYY